ncbi:MAG: DUF935 domain-containing protein [Pseudomonadota bacterium]|nr:DUF935 domain-containing protein [Pseudomonadota bacterium]
MSKILDQFGKPIDTVVIDEPQTARVASLQNQYLTPMLGGLTPARLARTLQSADQGDLIDQHRLFADMEERDGHIRAEMDKRKNVIVALPWDIVPPRNATSAEIAAADWVREVLQDAVDPIEDLLLALMDAVGHGFAPVELEWRKEGSEVLPAFIPRPQEWFRLSQDRADLRLRDSSVDGAALLPFGWVMHTQGKAKTGYLGRMGLYRTLVWPFLYKAYALGDFAEFLETYGLPIIVGKYFAGATADEKASLMRAVTALGHDARAIMPQEMTLEVQKVTGGAGDSAHLSMMAWAERSESKSILGQTLTAEAGAKGSHALGKVHNEVRHDIRDSDARQLAATVTRDLIYPLIALNRAGVSGLARSPRLIFDTSEQEDLSLYADALPKLVGVGFKISRTWAQGKLHVPEPADGEDVLVPPVAKPAAVPIDDAPPEPLTADVPVPVPAPAPVVPPGDGPVELADILAGVTAPAWAELVDSVKALVEQATDLTALQRSLVKAFGGAPQETIVRLMGAAMALAELKGMVDVVDAT